MIPFVNPLSPFPVLQRSENTFTALQNVKESAVSMVNVKPDYLDKLVAKIGTVFSPDSAVKETEIPMATARSGRYIRFTDRRQA